MFANDICNWSCFGEIITDSIKHEGGQPLWIRRGGKEKKVLFEVMIFGVIIYQFIAVGRSFEFLSNAKDIKSARKGLFHLFMDAATVSTVWVLWFK